MPYIKQEDRNRLSNLVNIINKNDICTEGELNYLISSLCKRYMEISQLNYKTINSIIGVLECAKLEYYRRIASDYENIKINENGDIY